MRSVGQTKLALRASFIAKVVVALALVIGAVALAPPAVSADDGSGQQALFLRMETGGHTAAVRALSVAANGLFATGGDDKTVRLWDAQSDQKKALRTIRLPTSGGAEGMVRAVALSPDGRYLLATGETGPTWNGPNHYSIDMFDLEAAGRDLKRLPNLPVYANALAFDPRGESFYAGFAEGGLVRWSLSGELRGQDAHVDGAVRAIDVAGDGRVSAVLSDGTVKVYDPGLAVLAQARLHVRPRSVAFSPDGRLLAVGTEDAGVIILSADRLARVRQLKPPSGLDGDLAAVTWARMKDGVHLLASGNVRQSEQTVVVVGWRDMGRGESYVVPVSRDRIIALSPLPAGGAAFVGAAPLVGRLGADGQLAFATGGEQADFRDVFKGQFGVSADGLTVEFGTKLGGDAPMRFTLGRDGGVLENAAGSSQVTPPRWAGVDLPVRDWWNGRPSLGKRPLEIADGDLARSLDVFPDNQSFLLGTDNSLRLYDGNGTLIKSVHTPATVWGVVAARQAPLAVAALGDGTLRWYSLRRDGLLDELAAVFIPSDAKRWIAWTPEGVFGISPNGGDDLLGYDRADGEKRQAEWISFAQLFDRFYKPALVYAKVTDPTQAAAPIAAAIHAVSGPIDPPRISLVQLCFDPPGGGGAVCQKFQEAQNRGFRRRQETGAPAPAVELGTIALPDGVRAVRLGIRTEIAANQSLEHIDVFVNDQLVERAAAQGMKPTPPAANGAPNGPVKTVIETERAVTLAAGTNVIQVRAYTNDNLDGRAEARLAAARDITPATGPQPAVTAEVTPPLPAKPAKPILYIAAFGVDKYKDPEAPGLSFAVADARSVAEDIWRRSNVGDAPTAIYAKVEKTELFNEQVTAESVRQALADIATKARAEDSVVVYLVGHGISVPINGKSTYLFLPNDVVVNDIARNAVSGDMLVTALAGIRARNMMVLLDTCYSGAFDVDFGGSLSKDLGRSSRILVTASAATETALDNIGGTKNGVFAYTMLNGLRGDARQVGDDTIDAGDIAQFLKKNVFRLAKEKANHEQQATSYGQSSTVFPLVPVTN